MIGIEKGIAIGIEKGEAIGIEKGKNSQARETVLNMHKMGMDINTISKATSLTCETVEKIIKEEETPEDE